MSDSTPRTAFAKIADFTNNRLFVFLLLLLGSFAVYAPALNGQLLWDDLYLVGENPFFKSPVFIFEVFKHYLYLDSISLYYRPVQNLSYMLDYWLWHGSPFGYHLGNAILHGLAGFVLYLLLRNVLPRLLKDRSDAAPVVSFLVAALWVIHPIHNAAVAYVAGRADSLATLFAVGAWLLYLRGLDTKRAFAISYYLAAAISLLLALCAKEIAFIWMTLFAAYLVGFNRTQRWQMKIAAVVVMLAVLGGYLVLRYLPISRPNPQAAAASSFAERFLLMLRALGDYVSLIFWPHDLHMDRIVYTINTYKGLNVWQSNIRFEYLSIIGLLALVLMVWMCIKRGPGQCVRLFGALWFMLGFLPISNLFPLNAQVAEHWIYMPSMGLLLFFAGCILAMPQRLQTAFAMLAVVALIPLGLRTATRSEDWADSERFFKQTIAAGGGTPRVHLNLALIYTKRGDDAAAEKILREAVERFPDYATARINLGINLVKQGRNAEAEKYLSYDKSQSQILAKTYPHTWSAALNLAKMRYDAKNTSGALRILDDSIKLYPDIWELVAYKAQIFKDANDMKDAIGAVKSYADANWWHYDSHMMLGRFELQNNDVDAALAAFTAATPLDIHGVEPLNMIARVNLALKRPEAAYDAQKKAVRRSPDQPLQYVLLSTILDELHKPEEAKAALQHAEELSKSAKANG